jgi:hypothetical protein
MVKKKSQIEVNAINNYEFCFTVLSSVGGGIVITLSCAKMKNIATPRITGAESRG